METYGDVVLREEASPARRAGGNTGGWPRLWAQSALLGAIALGLVAVTMHGPGEPGWRPLNQDAPAIAHVRRMDEALARWDRPAARREWDRAYSSALVIGGWRGMIAVGEASVRLAEGAGPRDGAPITPRGIFQIALTRAEHLRSLEGALRAAEAFADLGDFALADLALHAAGSVAGDRADLRLREGIRALPDHLAAAQHPAATP